MALYLVIQQLQGVDLKTVVLPLESVLSPAALSRLKLQQNDNLYPHRYWFLNQ